MDHIKTMANRIMSLKVFYVKTFSCDIGMEFGLDKCSKTLNSPHSVMLDVNTKELDQEQTYKYSGMQV